ncbi:cyclin-like protein [Baffinella frigidus]|nr:cyclin-like protein [Cryptophyta sp. CCMP2293]
MEIYREEETWKRSKRGAEAEDMKTAVDKGGSVGKRNRSALADVTNSKISTRASARAAQEKVLPSKQSERWAEFPRGVDAILSPGVTDAVVGISLTVGERGGEELVHASRAPRCEFEQDLARAQDPQFCIDYVGEIMNNLIESEAKLMPSATYMDTVQHDINPTMRGILVDWLVEVCMLLASKYEEIFAPQVEDFVYITDGTYSAHEVLHMESVVLNALRFSLTAVTPHTFLRRLTSLMCLPDELRHLCEYLCEITIQEYAYIKYRPSRIAVSSVILALHTMGQEILPSLVRRVMESWRIPLEEIVPCCRALHATHMRITDKSRTLQASWEKYSHSRWSRASLVQPNPGIPFSHNV